MPSTIVINSNNVVQDGNNNQLIYNFPNSVLFTEHEIAVQSINMYYCWQNINAYPLQNNTFQYTWNGADVVLNYTVVIPNGLYNISDINAYLQSQMIANGTYLINSSGQYVYYLEMLLNPSSYAVQINGFLVPATLPSGWSLPSNFPTGSLQGTFAPNFVIPTSSKFNLIVGFPTGYTVVAGGILDTSPSAYSVLSTTTPQIQPNPNVFVSSSNILNKYSIQNSILYNVASNVGFGSLISITPPQFAWNKLINGTYNQLRIQFLGSDYSPIKLLDPNITIVLVIRDLKTIIPKSIREKNPQGQKTLRG